MNNTKINIYINKIQNQALAVALVFCQKGTGSQYKVGWYKFLQVANEFFSLRSLLNV